MPADKEGIDQLDAGRYVGILEEIRVRVDATRPLLLQQPLIQPNIEFVALHLRKVLELIVMGSLVTNRAEIEATATAFRGKDAPGARKLAKQVNPDYWPKATARQDSETGPTKIVDIEGALREEDWGRAYGFVSDLLHARNPYEESIDLSQARDKLVQIRSEIMALLNHHVVTLLDRNYILICQMLTETGKVQVATFVLESQATAGQPVGLRS